MMAVDETEIDDLALGFVADLLQDIEYLDVCEWVADRFPEEVAEDDRLYDQVYDQVKMWAETARRSIEEFRKELRGKQ